MSSLIETNNEELEALLNDVYNLPARNAGNNGYDLEIEIDIHDQGMDLASLTPDMIQVDWNQASDLVYKTNGSTWKMFNIGIFGRAGYGSSDFKFFKVEPTFSQVDHQRIVLQFTIYGLWYGTIGGTINFQIVLDTDYQEIYVDMISPELLS